MLDSSAPVLDPPLEAMRRLTRGVPVRVVTDREVITDHFSELDEHRETPRLHLADHPAGSPDRRFPSRGLERQHRFA